MAKTNPSGLPRNVKTSRATPAKVALFDRTVDKLGQLQHWALYKFPFEGKSSEHMAYVRGFRQRADDFLQGLDTHATVDFRRTTDAAAFERGYVDAKKQEV